MHRLNVVTPYESTTKRYVRWPLLFLVLAIIFGQLFLYIVVRFIVKGYERLRGLICRRAKGKIDRLVAAKSYKEWYSLATQLDEQELRVSWKRNPKSPFYDFKLMETTVFQLQEYREKDQLSKLIDLLSVIFEQRNDTYGICNEDLYSKTYVGTKDLIHEFIDEVVSSTKFVAESNLPRGVKLKFFRKSKKDFGAAALCLSGGGGLGLYHLGVVRALFDANLLPKTIAGTSAGSVIAAWICVRTDDEINQNLNADLYRDFNFSGGRFWNKIYRYLRTGSIFSVDDWRRRLKAITRGNTTFDEAYRRTGRVLSIQITSGHRRNQPVVVNYKTAPRVCIWSAILASSSIPNLIPPVELMQKNENGKIIPYHRLGKTFNDGSIKNDIPISYLKERLNVTYTIVSQANPHVVPFVYSSRGSCGDPNTHRGGVGLRGGFLLSTLEAFLKLEMRKWITLLDDFDIFPKVRGQPVHHLFLQDYHGTVTIFTRPWMRDYAKILSQPSYEDFQRFIERGSRFCYPKLQMVANHMKFLECLESCSKGLSVADVNLTRADDAV